MKTETLGKLVFELTNYKIQDTQERKLCESWQTVFKELGIFCLKNCYIDNTQVIYL